MTRVCDVINANHQHIVLVIARQTGDNKVARNWIAAMERCEPFDVCQWMRVKAEVTWKLEYNTHLVFQSPVATKWKNWQPNRTAINLD